jgi:hypothetical protein
MSKPYKTRLGERKIVAIRIMLHQSPRKFEVNGLKKSNYSTSKCIAVVDYFIKQCRIAMLASMS